MYSKEKIFSTLDEITKAASSVKPYVAICQPRRGVDEVAVQQLDGYAGLDVDFSGFSHGFGNVFGEKVDVARNILIDRAIESGAKYLLFAGDDTILPYDGFIKLHETAEANPGAAVVGVYYIKLSTPMIHVRNGEWVTPADVSPDRGVFPILSAGMDAALIPIELLKKMNDPELPWCCIASPGLKDKDGKEYPFVGEDNFFWYRWQKAGNKLLCDPRVQCLHMDTATGKYTAHPSVDIKNYFTQIPITTPLVIGDRKYISERWHRPLKKEVAI